jgi:antitoxin component of RelBE/YafQ-DinJ toxin-antitoxin module
MNKKETLIVRIDKQTKSKLSKVAMESKRTMSDYVRLLIEFAAKEKIKV